MQGLGEAAATLNVPPTRSLKLAKTSETPAASNISRQTLGQAAKLGAEGALKLLSRLAGLHGVQG